MILGDLTHHIFNDPHFKAPAPDNEKLRESQFVLVRHAVTYYNTEYGKIIRENGLVSEALRELNSDPRMIDCGLRPEGVQQCEYAQQHVNKVNFKYVLVSPLLRTMQTAIHLFKNHPNKPNIKFIVTPLIKEDLDSGYCADLSIDKLRQVVDPLIAEYSLKFDFSQLYISGVRDLYQVQVLSDVSTIKELYERMSVNDLESDYGFNSSIIKEVYQIYPKTLERAEAIYERAQEMKSFFRHFMKFHKINSDEKCGVVSHSDIIEAITAKGINKDTGRLVGQQIVRNCELLPYNLNE